MKRMVVVAAGVLFLACGGKGGGADVTTPDERQEPDQVDTRGGTDQRIPDSPAGDPLPDVVTDTQVQDSPDVEEVIPVDIVDALPELKDLVKWDSLWPPADNDPGDGASTDTKVKDIQQSQDSLQCLVPNGTMLIGLDISLKSVVVTAPRYTFQVTGEKLDGFYVADAEGGPFSGIHATYPAENGVALSPGMVLQLIGAHKENSCFSIFAVDSMLVSDAEAPEPVPFETTPEAVTADPEQFEGVLIRVSGVTVTSANPDKTDGADNQEFEVDGVLRVGNDYKLAYMSPQTDARHVGDYFESLVGVVKFASGKFHLMPRFDSDMVLGTGPMPDGLPEVEDVLPEVEDVLVDGGEVLDVVEMTDTPDDQLSDLPPEISEVEALDIPPTPGSPIVITEIMYDPEVITDEKGEWFELYNATEAAVDLNGWRLEDNKGQVHIIDNGGAFLLQPGSFVLLGSNNISATNGGADVGYLIPYTDFAMGNSDDAVVLKNQLGEVVDSVTYNEKEGWPAGKGASIELLHPNLDNQLPANWKVADKPFGDGSNMGTPGFGSWK